MSDDLSGPETNQSEERPWWITSSLVPDGETISDRYSKCYHCSNCGHHFDLRILKGQYAPSDPPCPRCGCKLRTL